MAKSFHDAWFDALYATLQDGNQSSPRGMLIQERLAAQVTFDASRALLVHPVRDLNYRFAVSEFLWMAAGCGLVEPVARFNSVMRRFSDDGIYLAGAYGPRIKGQWGRVVNALKTDPDSRQAVALIWRPDDATPPVSKDVPCTIAAQFLIRGGQVHGLWTMRSNDLWLGLPYDAFTFARLTACVAGELNLPVGAVTITAGSSHLYEEHWDAARRCIREWEGSGSVKLAPLSGFPPHELDLMVISGRRPRAMATADILTATGEPTPFPGAWEQYARVLESSGKAEALAILEEA